ncbi:MAG: histidine kinase dimerization/phospho-acceptor domain-containing protein, partial [Nitrospirota bacterium]
MSLKIKIAFFFSLVIVAISVTLGFIFFVQVKEVLLENLKERGRLLTENLAYNSRYGVFAEDLVALDQLALGILEAEEARYVFIFNNEKALVKKFKLGIVGAGLKPAPTSQIYFSSPVMSAKQMDSFPPELLEEQTFEKGATAERIQYGSVQIGMSLHLLARQIRMILIVAAVVTGILMTFGIGLIYYLSQFYMRPLQVLASMAKKVAGGDFSQVAPVTTQDEIGELTTLFNEMTRSMALREEQIKEHARLQEMDRLKSEFVSNVSHEIRTPLTSIKGYIDNLTDGMAGPLGERQREYMNSMTKSADRLIRMIDDLLDISKIESGEMKTSRALLSFPDLIHEVSKNLKPVAEEKGVQILIRPFAGAGQLYGDSDKLEQVVTNILDNAIKFTPAGGEITLTL